MSEYICSKTNCTYKICFHNKAHTHNAHCDNKCGDEDVKCKPIEVTESMTSDKPKETMFAKYICSVTDCPISDCKHKKEHEYDSTCSEGCSRQLGKRVCRLVEPVETWRPITTLNCITTDKFDLFSPSLGRLIDCTLTTSMPPCFKNSKGEIITAIVTHWMATPKNPIPLDTAFARLIVDQPGLVSFRAEFPVAAAAPVIPYIADVTIKNGTTTIKYVEVPYNISDKDSYCATYFNGYKKGKGYE